MPSQPVAPPSWEDIPVANWSEFNDKLHSLRMMPKTDGSGNHARSPFMFRGMSVAAWELKTSLERLNSDIRVVERPLLRSFRKYARQGSVLGGSEWEVLAVAQHNGLPTRCLDWTSSPLVAAHFATAEREFIDQPGVIWCVNLEMWRNFTITKDLLSVLKSDLAWMFDVRLLKQQFDDLPALDRTQADVPEMLLFFEPPSIDARIENQFGSLSMMNGPDKSHDSYLRHVATKFPGMVVRFVIDAGAKQEIRDKLDQNNISERMLFPGLPGLADWLRRYYGKA